MKNEDTRGKVWEIVGIIYWKEEIERISPKTETLNDMTQVVICHAASQMIMVYHGL